MSAHTLDALTACDGAGHIADCACGLGFWGLTRTDATQAWQAHTSRMQPALRVRTDPVSGREHAEADPEQYGREENQRLTQQLGAWT